MLFSLCCGQACKSTGNYRTEKIDSLAKVLYECEQQMNIDPEDIRKREKGIREQMGKINLNYIGGANQELAFMLEDYKNVADVYARYLKEHSNLDKELASLKEQLRSLKKSSDEGLNEADFQKYLATEREDINEMKEATEKYAVAVQHAEPLYQRIAPKIQACADSLKAE